METSQKINYKACSSKEELLGILQLQKSNLFSSLSPEESEKEGFLTCEHNYELLKKWNNAAAHIIAVQNDSIIGYLLTMTSEASEDMLILKSMFQIFNEVEYLGKPISMYNYLVVGQVCIAKGYRGQGVLYKLYKLYLSRYKNNFDFAITEIAVRNKRSLQAHIKNGFQEIFKYKSAEGEEWCIVILDWNKKNRRD